MFDCVAGNGSKRGGAGSRKENPSSSPTGPGCARTGGEDEKSGVTGDCHAPFCGSPGVKFPGATRHLVGEKTRQASDGGGNDERRLTRGSGRSQEPTDESQVEHKAQPSCADWPGQVPPEEAALEGFAPGSR